MQHQSAQVQDPQRLGPTRELRPSDSPDQPIRAARWVRRLLIPDDGQTYAPPRLTLAVIAVIAATLAAWRMAILGISYVWGQLGLDEPWSGGVEQMWLWRFSVRWDSGWYLGIIQNGYFYDPDGQSSIAFFPMFPMLTRYLDYVLPGSEVFAGLVIVHLALFGALIYIYQLVRIDFPQVVAWRTLFFLLIFPASFFFSAFYTESLLLFGFAGALYHARRGQWLLAAFFAIFTGLTKLIGVVLVIPIALEVIAQRALSTRNLRPALYTALAPAGTLAYLAYIHVRFGDFRMYFEAQSHWLRQSFSPEPLIVLVQRLTGGMPNMPYYPANVIPLHTWYLLIDVGSVLLFLAAGIYLWLRVRPSYGALVLAGAMVPALSGNPLGMARYMSILFPTFIILARINSEPLRNMITILSMFGLMFITFLFVNGYWAG